MVRHSTGKFLFISACLCSSIFLYLVLHKLDRTLEREEKKFDLQQKIRERRNMFLVFVGGMPRSGTTLMRTMLDAHPDIRCGPETWVIQEILNMQSKWAGDTGIVAKLSDAGVYPTALDNAMAEFLLEIIIGHGPPTTYYCNKDPYTADKTKYLHKLFPNAKYILMVRDARAFAHSVVTRGIIIHYYDIKNYRDIITKWSIQIGDMYTQCLEVGDDVCLPVRYEQLVLRPMENTKKIFNFLGIPWSHKVLHHEDYLNETELPDREYSTSQVSKALNLDALTSWFGKIPKDVERDMAKIAPMLKLLGYDPNDPKPNYGEPDDFVKQKLKKEQEKDEENRNRIKVKRKE